MPSQIRVSIGSAIVLGLAKGKLDAEPTTAYLMTYTHSKCTANCGFCPQARTNSSKAEMLSRVTWPTFTTKDVLRGIAQAVNTDRIGRVCIQALNYPHVFSHLDALVRTIKQIVDVPVSVSCQPLNSKNLWTLSKAGVDRIAIALDAATENIFNNVKGKAAGGSYTWRDEFLLLRVAIGVFGEGNVSTHLIVGLGETEKEATIIVQKCVDMRVLPALFAFTPVEGTLLSMKPQPRIDVYRRIQLARYLLVNGLARLEDLLFDVYGQIVDFGISKPTLANLVESGTPFLTSGCPSCNRPFYNEKPGGVMYNYPRGLRSEEIEEIKSALKLSRL